ncbi:MAG: amidohydrolase [Archaeoglobaceae archaeon]|nr:amidohydrolase [Archaeoglobaceae archaeon]MCX8151903.1 amidohydrolase [Archaeoglobaceae archaeon]MDW8013292.1 amidohydrolase [Archaeoglobaceae archaeon]
MILIRNARILGKEKGNILVEDNKIVAVGDIVDKSDVVIDAENLAAIPGLFNSHTHAAMVLFRGYADDMKLHEWLQKKIWPAEAKLNAKAVYWGTKLACIEMLKGGTTFFNDMYFFSEEVARAASECGIRACIASAFFDFFNKDLLEENIKRVEKEVKEIKKNPLILPAVGPHAVYTVSLEGLKRSAEIAEKYDALIHFHLAETEKEVVDFKRKHGEGIVKTLDNIGFLSERLVAAHSVWLEKNEIEILAKRKVNVAHCPTSNMKLCVGKAIDYRSMREFGVNFCIGTDSAASNNNLDMFEEMRFAALLQKFYYNDPTLMKAEEVFDTATKNAAKAFRLNAGEIAEGKLADIVLVNLDNLNLVPGHNLISDLVYSANSSCVETVIVDGKIVVENGYFEGEEEVVEKVKKIALDLVKG